MCSVLHLVSAFIFPCIEWTCHWAFCDRFWGEQPKTQQHNVSRFVVDRRHGRALTVFANLWLKMCWRALSACSQKVTSRPPTCSSTSNQGKCHLPLTTQSTLPTVAFVFQLKANKWIQQHHLWGKPMQRVCCHFSRYGGWIDMFCLFQKLNRSINKNGGTTKLYRDFR